MNKWKRKYLELLTKERFRRHELMFEERLRYYDQRFDSQDRAVASAFEAAATATVKADTATEKRFDGVNEFRAALADQAAKLMPRSEFDAQYRSLADKMDSREKSTDEKFETLSKQMALWSGRSAGMGHGWAIIAAVAVVAVGLLQAILPTLVHAAK